MAAEKIKTNIFKIEKNKSWLVLLKSSHVLKLSLGFWLLIFSWAGSGAFYPVNKWRKLPYKSSPLLIGIRLKIDRFQKRSHDHGMAFQTSCQKKCSGIHYFPSLKGKNIRKTFFWHNFFILQFRFNCMNSYLAWCCISSLRKLFSFCKNETYRPCNEKIWIISVCWNYCCQSTRGQPRKLLSTVVLRKETTSAN